MINRVRQQLDTYFTGKEEVTRDILICLLSGGHVLLEDVPGVGKTTLAKVLSRTVGADFGRIQFTPDTLPSDVTGLSIYNARTGQFDFQQGAVMHNLVLADEINRTSPKTQASLLEAMAEGQVTVEGKVHPLGDPFMVIATQNPVEFVGTYPLPEAQLDRFMMRLSLGYPKPEAEVEMTRRNLEGFAMDSVEPVCTLSDILRMKEEVAKVNVSDKLLLYIQQICDLTRQEESFVMGASPRAGVFMALAARALAYMEGRDFVKPDDVKAVCVNVLHHRLSLTSREKIRKTDIDSLLRSLMLKVKVPME